MDNEHQSGGKPFLRSPLGLALLGFLAIALFLLILEHQAHIFTGNWFLWLLPLACMVMHMFHGGHGGGGHDHKQGPASRDGDGQ